ncbi:MAG: endolytic transglycosylase MltG [Armatimonadota bacterium]|nr:endolytic transglycosylase MltG [Armatimonadota bacterium]
MKKVMGATKGYLAALLIVLNAAVWTLVLGSRPVTPGSSTPVRVAVPRGASARDVAKILVRNRVIRSPFVFLLTCRMSGKAAKLKPGVYELTSGMNLPEIVRVLVRGEALQAWVTIPEGYTIRQIGDVLQERGVTNAEAFVHAALTKGFEFSQYPFIGSECLEGYLFPDTYLVARGTQPERVIERMLDAFEHKVLVPYRPQIERAALRHFGLQAQDFAQGLHKLLTVASLVEREAKIPKDRPLIAAVIYNRLKRGLKLEIDATVTYVPGDSRANKSRIYLRDLKTDSPYNTYLHPGLPPGPICNPGLASIRAALEPADVDYLYYVARPDGSHVFSRTLQEHNRAKSAVRKGNL